MPITMNKFRWPLMQLEPKQKSNQKSKNSPLSNHQLIRGIKAAKEIRAKTEALISINYVNNCGAFIIAYYYFDTPLK